MLNRGRQLRNFLLCLIVFVDEGRIPDDVECILDYCFKVSRIATSLTIYVIGIFDLVIEILEAGVETIP